MKLTLSRITLAASLAFSLFVMSCGSDEASPDTADSLSDEMIAQMDEFVSAIESAKDKESAEAAAVKLDKIADELVAITGRLEALGEPSDEDKKIVKEKMDKAQADNEERMKAAFGNIRNAPEAGPILMKALSAFTEKMKTVEATNQKYGIN